MADGVSGSRHGSGFSQLVGSGAQFDPTGADGLRGQHLFDDSEYWRFDWNLGIDHNPGAQAADSTKPSVGARDCLQRLADEPSAGSYAGGTELQLHGPAYDRTKA